MNFALIMFSLLVVTGAVTLLDLYVFSKRRAAGAAEPWWIEYPKSFFPVILIVFLLRSFLVEPFKIPSGSMLPTLLVGDFILVNKFTYGLRLPVINMRMTDGSPVQRGDVVVFRWPGDRSQVWVKRVIGLPGDRIAMPTPGYPAYRNLMHALGLEAVEIECGAETRWALTPEMIAAAHADFGSFLASGLVRKNSNPNLASSFNKMGNCPACRFQLARFQPA